MEKINKSEVKYLVALNKFPKFGPIRLSRIKKHFSSLKQAFEAGAKELAKAGIEENICQEFTAARTSIDPDELMEEIEKEGVKIITIEEKLYPPLLKEIYNPPQLLYYKGDLKDKGEFILAVVGSRKFSTYGQRAAEEIIRGLVRNKLSIASGLAIGIDAFSHQTALEENGRTIAVLGSGLDKKNIYPSLNRYLADKIVGSGGALISEFPLGTAPLKHHFPQRNRIISGISLGALIIEAGEKSGALITAHFALEQNREVFAVPGSIYSPTSHGTNDLIKKGARVVTSATDIIEALNLIQVASFIENNKIIPETPEEEKILNFLNKEPLHINELVRMTKLDTNIINSTLTIMEMKGKIKNIGNMQYVLAR